MKRHAHWFTSLWWNFGPFGRQDVHVHSCIEVDDCHRVVIGEGRSCDTALKHWRETL